MQSFHHKPIKRFEIKGSIYDDAHIDRLRVEYLALLMLSMKSDGYAPRLDIDPDFTIEYIGKPGYYFHLSIYGVFVGKKQIQNIDGMDGYRPRMSTGPKKKTPQKKTA